MPLAYLFLTGCELQLTQPGVYVDEVPDGPSAIVGVSTSVTGLVGHVETLPADDVVVVTSMLEYEQTFGGPDDSGRYVLHEAVKGFFDNGGAEAHVVAVGTFADDPGVARFEAGLATLAEDRVDLVAMPDAAAALSPADLYAVDAAALAHCAEQACFAVLDLPQADVVADTAADFRAGLPVAALPTGALRDGAAYVPWLEVATPDGATRAVPPSGAMAGVYARVDREHGVWQAPANTPVAGITGLAQPIDDALQETLNVDAATGLSINALRSFSGRGPLVWGGRTLAGNDPEWRYVQVRRYLRFLERSVDEGTEWVLFEPDEPSTWQTAAAQVETWLTEQWRQGAMQGATPEDAFFVRVGLGETMTETDVKEGRVIISVGFAPVRPAEFVIVQIVHEP